MKKILLTAGCLAFGLLLIGAGCGSDEPTEEPEQPTPAATAPIIKQPGSEEPADAAIDFCEAQGYDVVFAFDPNIRTNRMYCAFQENTGCDVVDYYRRRCSLSSAIAITLPDVEHVSFCPDVEEPVCGEDARTYINQCVANAQQIRAIHDGPCTEADLSSAETTAPAVDDAETGKNTIAPSSGKSTDTAWLNVLVGLLGKKEGSRIEACPFGEETLYYQEENCPDCFSTLYNESGAVVCFPHNDLDDKCPTAFNKDARSSCSVIWEN